MTRHSLELHRGGSTSPHPHYSKQADISRLLDPAYAPSPLPSSSSYSSHGSSAASYSPPSPRREIYIDHVGDLHDPDYRDFPAFPAPSPSKRRRGAEERVPAWERGYGFSAHAPADDDDEYDAEEDPFTASSRLRRPTAGSGTRPYLHPHQHAWYYSTTTSDSPASRAHSPLPASRAHSPTHFAAPPPTSFLFDHPAPGSVGHVDDELALDDEPEDELEGEKPRWLLRRASRSHKESADEDAPEQERGTPTCGRALKVQLSAMAFSFRLGVFRAKRRMREGLERTRTRESG